MTGTGWIEQAIALVDHRDIDNHVVKASATAELAALRADLARTEELRRREQNTVFGLYKQIVALRQATQLAADMIGETDDHVLAAMARSTAIVAVEALRSIPPSSMRLVSVERLKQIHRYVHCEVPCIPLEFTDWLAALIAGDRV